MLFAAYHVRYRAVGTTQWRYAVEDYSAYGGPSEWEQPGLGVHELEVAAIRHRLEAETPTALTWSERMRYASGAPIRNATVAATVDTVTVQWDAQPYAGYGFVEVRSANGWRRVKFREPAEPGTHRHVLEHVEPGTDYVVKVYKAYAEKSGPSPTLSVRTLPPPAGWTEPPLGPQNLRATVTSEPPLTCLTIEWDAPYPNADPYYRIMVVEEGTGLQIDSKAIYDDTTSYFTCGRDTHRNVEPGRVYSISVVHRGIRVGSDEIMVSTAPVPNSGLAEAMRDAAARLSQGLLRYLFALFDP